MAKIKDIHVSLDTEELQVRNLSKQTIAEHLYKPNGWEANKVKYPNIEKSNESKVVDPKYPYITLWHSHFSGGYQREHPFTKRSYWFEEVSTFTIAGLSKHRPNNDRVKRQARDLLVDCVKTHGGYFTFKRFDLAIDVELADINGFEIGNFFLLNVSTSQNINSPFDFFVGDDGARTYYSLKMKKNKYDPQKKKQKYVPMNRKYMYLKHEKEGLKDRFILRFEASYPDLPKFGGDADKLINYIDKDLKNMKLFCFDNVETGNNFKRLYRDRIPKKGYPNVTPTQLKKIRSEADNEINLELTDEIRDHIHNVLSREEPKPVAVEEQPYIKAYGTLFGKKIGAKASSLAVIGNTDPSIGLWTPTKESIDREEPKQVEVEPISMEIIDRIRNLTKNAEK